MQRGQMFHQAMSSPALLKRTALCGAGDSAKTNVLPTAPMRPIVQPPTKLVLRLIGPPHKDHYLSAGGTLALVKVLEVCGVGATMTPDNWALVQPLLKEIQFENPQIQFGRQFLPTTATPAEFEMAQHYVGDITVEAN